MKDFTVWIVRKFIANYRNIEDPQVRAHYGAIEAWTSIVVNLLLFVIKIIAALLIHSVALFADAIHTLSDTGTSIVVLIGFKLARRPGDREHPFGHGRAEAVATLIVAILLIVAGIELLKSALWRIKDPVILTEKLNWFIVAIVIGTIVVKEIIARFARQLGRMIQSQALEADFWHHRSDALSTVLVLASMLAAHWGFAYFDGAAGGAVALIVIYSGYVIARKAIDPLLGEKPAPELLRQIAEIALKTEDVAGVHDIIVHRYGQMNSISLHIELPDNLPITKLHDISENVEDAIEQKLGGSAVVHIDPFNKDHPRYQEIHDLIKKYTDQNARIEGFHDLRIVGHGRRVKVIFDITLNEQVTPSEAEDIRRYLRLAITKHLPDVRLAIKTEPKFAYTQ